MMCEYSRWANAQLLEDCAALSDEELFRDLGVEYESVHGTLDHSLLVDRIWLARFTGQTEVETRYSQRLTDSFSSLREQRFYTDEDLTKYTASLTEAALLKQLQYTMVRDPIEVAQPISSALLNLFHHQNHYRAQAQALVHMLGVKPRMVDLLNFQRQTGMGGLAIP